LQQVLAFKKRIEEEKRYLFKQYGAISQFAETLEEHLGRWLRDHGGTATGLITTGATTSSSTGSRTSAVAPEFDYWIMEAIRLLDAEVPDHTGAIFCADKAIGAASSDIEWARASNCEGVAQFRLGRVDESITSFDAIANRFSTSIDADRRDWQARALINKGVTLGALDRSAEEIAVYDDLLARFGSATELPLRERVANALFNKGVRLGALDRSAEEIAVYDDLLARFGSATELPLRAPVANALFNKGVRLGALDRSAEAIAVYDDLLARFGSATELPLRELISKTKELKDSLQPPPP
jgi:tetratricopeptide (TPR) repeat protein